MAGVTREQSPTACETNAGGSYRHVRERPETVRYLHIRSGTLHIQLARRALDTDYLDSSARSAAEVLEAPHGCGKALAFGVGWIDSGWRRSPVALSLVFSCFRRERSELSASFERSHLVGLSLDYGADRAIRCPLRRRLHPQPGDWSTVGDDDEPTT